MSVELQFVWLALSMVAGVGVVLVALLIGIVLFGTLAALCEWREAKQKENNA